MKKIIIITAFVLGVSVSKAQLVPTVDTVDFHPIIDTSVKGFAACKINTINLALSPDSVTRLALKVTSDNLQNYSDIEVLFLNNSLQPLGTTSFTLQDDALPVHLTKNYTDVQNNGVEYLFQVVATYLAGAKHISITFK